MKRFYALTAISTVLMLTACAEVATMTTPTQMNNMQMTVGDKILTKSYDLYSFDDYDVQTLSKEIQSSEHKHVTLNISYMISNADGKTLAEKKAKRIEDKLAADKITDVSVELVPVDRPDKAGLLVVSYKKRVASPPEGCSGIPGGNGATDMSDADSYRYSCATKTALSKMISNPDDLLGRSGSESADSKRAGKMVDKYMSGTANKDIGGYNASDVGKGGINQ